MPTIFTHAVVAGAIASIAPDVDTVAFKLGIAHADPFGHRGASHSFSPIGARFFSPRGLAVLWSELRWVWLPAAAIALPVWRWRARARPTIAA